jgi:hypothetical protein
VTPSLRPLTPTYVEPQPTATEEPTPTYTAAPTVTHTPEPTATPVPRVEIVGLSWQPVRVVNDKVYDGKVVFEAEGDKVLGYAELRFIPKEYPHLSKEAFPKEDPRRFVLEPLDGAFDELKEEFAVDVEEIIGGREYVIEAVVKDEDENVAVERIKTPYIREFKNIAPLDDKLIGVVYYSWYPGHWTLGYTGTPLLGKYDSRNKVVVNRHIDWATAHGIDFFAVSWPGIRPWKTTLPNEVQNLEHGILESEFINQIKFVIRYEPSYINRVAAKEAERYGVNKTQVFFTDMDYMADHYFNHPSYLKTDGQPIVIIYAARDLYDLSEQPTEILREMRENLKDKRYEIYLIGEMFLPAIPGIASWLPPKEEFLEEMNGITNWIAFRPWDGSRTGVKTWDEVLNDVKTYYPKWQEYTNSHNMSFVPFVYPGFDDRNCSWGSDIVLPRYPDRFREFVELALSYNSHINMMLIATWNDWNEGSNIEPSREYNFIDLRIIKGELTQYQMEP